VPNLALQQPLVDTPSPIYTPPIASSSLHEASDYPNLPYSSPTEVSVAMANGNGGGETLTAMLSALEVMQEHFFAVWQGQWPTSIDWTGAVLGTYVAAALITLSSSLEYVVPAVGTASLSEGALLYENTINKHFTQLTTYYFGQNDISLRGQAFDDMLWVVLGWLDAINFIEIHSALHYPQNNGANGPDYGKSHNTSSWYGNQFVAPFAHRARIFYDIAYQGWDTELCGGGMIWSPYLTPYKNAITNELFISASIGMYLYFPGDKNPAPFEADGEDPTRTIHQGHHKVSEYFPTASESLVPAKPHDSKYLKSAKDAYRWLLSSNMTNHLGLYTDGFHIRGYEKGKNSSGTKCDERDEMVYTYNQGVLLSGQRGLWEGTGTAQYLFDGYTLIESVIAATGWYSAQLSLGKWRGLGRSGILEEACDASGSCTQNGQTFKGIFFHHLTQFCAPLPLEPMTSGITFAATPQLKLDHEKKCSSYGAWVTHNAQAARSTVDDDGEYGMWWGRSYKDQSSLPEEVGEEVPEGVVDHQNDPRYERRPVSQRGRKYAETTNDPNDRGRGRTVETQGGGVSVLRAMWEIAEMRAGAA
jgi:Glycosyl hydrolase family 76